MSKEKWFLGKVSRQRAEEVLNACGADGSFVIRSSESVNGAYALSVLYCKTVHTYRILPTENGQLAVQTLKGVQSRRFVCLDLLVKEYRSPQNGLVCGLTNPVGLNENNSSKQLSYDTPAPGPRAEPLSTLSMSSVAPHTPPASVSSGGTRTNTAGPSAPVRQPETQPSASTEKRDPPPTRDLPPLPKDRELLPRPPASKIQPVAKDAQQLDNEVKAKMISRLNDIKTVWSGMDNNFMDSVQSYANEGGLDVDIASMKRGGECCAELQTVLAKEAVPFQRELEIFMTKADILRQLFDFNLTPRKTSAYNRINVSDVDLDAFLGRLRDCQEIVKSLNRKACSGVQELLGIPSSTVTRSTSRKPSRTLETVTERIFEVKQEGALKLSKQRLKMDIKNDTLSVVKADGTTDFTYSKVLQLIKNNKSKNKLSIVFEGGKKKDFIFEQSSQREAFCQLMQYIRNKHSDATEPDCVSIFCGSWNMGDAIPPSDITSWFLCTGSGKCLDRGMQSVPHDIYVIGTQETGMHERDWMHKVMDTIHDITSGTFHVVAMDALWHIRIMVIVKEEHKNRISHVQTSTVKTGIANALGNKGAVAVSFQFGGTSFCFINAHLTSGSEKCVRRNNNYHDIIRSLNLGEDRFRIFDLTDRFDHLYFLGDLNYRIEMEVQEILGHIKKKEYGTLSKVDQLRREKDSNKVFTGFNEEEILFPPTYRYERGTRETYSHLKVKKTGVRINVPSWCDRILWRSYPETHNVCHAYGCTDDIMTSDHSPLFSNFQVGVRGQYVSKEEIRRSNNKFVQSTITFDSVEAILKAPGKSCFYLQFHSLCLTSSVKSKRNQKLDNVGLGANLIRTHWSAESLSTLEPIISDREFLVDQHLLICLRNEDDNEVAGECVIALRSMIGTSPQPFEERLTRKGEDTGQIRGRMLVKARDSENAPKEKTYDFIRVNRDDEEMKKIKDMGVEVATYSGIDEINSAVAASKHRPMVQPPTRSGPFPDGSRQRAEIYGEETGTVPEEEYADPDLVVKQFGTSPPKISSSLFPLLNSRPSSELASPVPHHTQLKADAENASKSPIARIQSGGSTSPTFPHTAISPSSTKQVGSPIFKAPLATPRPCHSGPAPKMSDVLAEFSNFELTPPNLSPVNVPRGSPTSGSPVKERSSYDKLSLGDKGPTFGITPSRPPAIPPARKKKDSRGVPGSVDEFLSMINLTQYSTALQDHGWDSVEFLGELTEDDLIDTGITNSDHCRAILERIQSLPL